MPVATSSLPRAARGAGGNAAKPAVWRTCRPAAGPYMACSATSATRSSSCSTRGARSIGHIASSLTAARMSSWCGCRRPPLGVFSLQTGLFCDARGGLGAPSAGVPGLGDLHQALDLDLRRHALRGLPACRGDHDHGPRHPQVDLRAGVRRGDRRAQVQVAFCDALELEGLSESSPNARTASPSVMLFAGRSCWLSATTGRR